MTPEQVEAGGQTIKVGKVRITETPPGSDYSGPFGVIQALCDPTSVFGLHRTKKLAETDQSRKTLFVVN